MENLQHFVRGYLEKNWYLLVTNFSELSLRKINHPFDKTFALWTINKKFADNHFVQKSLGNVWNKEIVVDFAENSE